VLKDSQPGKGSTFVISISTDIAISIQEAATLPSGHLEKLKFSATSKALIVDDSPDNRDLMAAYLSRLVVDFDIAENGRQAIKMATQTKYDLIFMDIQMPEMDGFEATRQIRRDEANIRHTVIVALTADAMVGDREKCLQAGMDDYLNKPLKSEKVTEILKKWVHTDL
jgi:two-component system CheB/CheR fusion protein